MVSIREVGPRDGFQNEPEVVPTDDKVRLVEMLARTGLRRLEVTSFVRAEHADSIRRTASPASKAGYGTWTTVTVAPARWAAWRTAVTMPPYAWSVMTTSSPGWSGSDWTTALMPVVVLSSLSKTVLLVALRPQVDEKWALSQGVGTCGVGQPHENFA